MPPQEGAAEVQQLLQTVTSQLRVSLVQQKPTRTEETLQADSLKAVAKRRDWRKVRSRSKNQQAGARST